MELPGHIFTFAVVVVVVVRYDGRESETFALVDDVVLVSHAMERCTMVTSIV